MWGHARMYDGTNPVPYLPIHPTLPCLLSPDGITLPTRQDSNLFNLACLRAKMKTDTILICKLMFANDVAFYAHRVPKLHEMCDALTVSCNLFGWKISTKKPVMLAMNGPPPCIQINSELVSIVNQFCYLGSAIAKMVTLNTKASSQIGRAASIFRKPT